MAQAIMPKFRQVTTARTGPEFLGPWQEGAYRQGLNFALGQLPQLQQQPFADVLEEVGGTPTNFTNIDMQTAGLTPEVLGQMENALFGQAAARTANQQRNILGQAAPGSSPHAGISALLGGLAGAGGGLAGTAAGTLMTQAQRFNDAVAQREATRLRGEYAPMQNLRAQQAQTAVETQRGLDERARRQLTAQYMQNRAAERLGLLDLLRNLATPPTVAEQYGFQQTVGYPNRGIMNWGPVYRA